MNDVYRCTITGGQSIATVAYVEAQDIHACRLWLEEHGYGLRKWKLADADEYDAEQLYAARFDVVRPEAGAMSTSDGLGA